MKSVIFSYPSGYCPDCHSRLKVYSLSRRNVKSVQGQFTAVHRIKICPNDRTTFRSGILDGIISRGCTYANDIMIEAAMQRFLQGRSSSEISSTLGISASHARCLSNSALDIFQEIHGQSGDILKAHMKSYILQIDGTTDSEYSMIVVVKDSVSGFVLYSRKCYSESEESIEDILRTVKEKFGMPSGITADMRSGIISAAMKVFPGVPIRICLMHFLRDLGKDLMADLHTDLGNMINHAGIKAKLKSLLRSIPDYNQKRLEEIESGYCTHREDMEVMAARNVLERIVSIDAGSGYCFPFSLRYLKFFMECDASMRKLLRLLPALNDKGIRKTVSTLLAFIRRITDNPIIRETARKLRDINSAIFQPIRKAFKIPRIGNLSIDVKYDPKKDDPVVHEKCGIIFGELGVYLKAGIGKHMFSAAKIAISRYRKRETMLFAQNPECTIPRTNNNMEIFFRSIRRNVRKRSGNIATGNILAQSGEKLALFQNIGNARYRDIVFGNEMEKIFAKHRKPLFKKGMTKKTVIKLVAIGTQMILDDSLSNTPYTPKAMDEFH